MADLIERLIIIDNRMAWLEQQKRDLSGSDPVAIAKLDQASRDCCEEYRALRESRSFRPPDDRFSDVLERHGEEIAHHFTSEELAEAIRAELLGEP
jgi:hypothetical protein